VDPEKRWWKIRDRLILQLSAKEEKPFKSQDFFITSKSGSRLSKAADRAGRNPDTRAAIRKQPRAFSPI
jgi:hypothetical protein